MTKTAKRRYRNHRLEVLHKTAEALHRVGAIDQAAMRGFDATCLTPVTATLLKRAVDPKAKI
jgi:DNA-binding transcriptional regulator YiaG